jgi:hypothetical protein
MPLKVYRSSGVGCPYDEKEGAVRQVDVGWVKERNPDILECWVSLPLHPTYNYYRRMITYLAIAVPALVKYKSEAETLMRPCAICTSC